MMYRNPLTAIALTISFAGTATVQAGNAGLIDTDRLGYSGTIDRFDTLTDAQNGSSPTDTISVGNRDLALKVAQNDSSEADQNLLLGSWWYTTDEGFEPGKGRAGWGNNRGNTGLGYLQMYDSDSSTDTNVEMSFGNFNGTYYTEFDLMLQGENANQDEFSRFSVTADNGNGGGMWHEYTLSLTAGGLEGVEVSPGVIEANNHPTSVTGSITGIFEVNENDDDGSTDNRGFYVLDLDLSMTNWAWENRNDLTPQVSSDGGATFFDGTFDQSTFRVIPSPTAALGALGIAGLGLLRRRRA